ncbi:MAG TPA: MFS transporter [Candidatus Binataceae bacterium]|nr:MFS transporter [Candidatus Binataceae bacterium]
MKMLQPRAWSVMLALFLTEIVVIGPNLTVPNVFLTPLIRAFGWSHAEAARIAFATYIAGAVAAPLVGWIMDRLDARWVIGAGLVTVALGYYCASHADSIWSMMAAFALLGTGAMLAGMLSNMVVAVNWFGDHRGFAGGLVTTGASLGIGIAPPLLTWTIARQGWPAAMRWLDAPILLLVLPLVLLVMRTRPPIPKAQTTSQEVATLAGLEFRPALATLAFWLCIVADFVFEQGEIGLLTHSLTYMIGVGFSAEHAAWIFSAQTLLSTLWTVPLGVIADRFGVRIVLACALLAKALGTAAFCGIDNPHLGPLFVVLFVICWGSPSGTVFSLFPVLLSEATGLRRFGSLSGILRCTSAVSMAIGPIWTGRIFDVTGSYIPAFVITIGFALVAALMVSLVRPSVGTFVLPTAGASPTVA